MSTPRFIRPIHPKAEISPTRAAITKVLGLGWWGQVKIHGHRAQIHLASDPSAPISVYNRHGQIHRKALPSHLADELRRIFRPERGWNVLDAEWRKEDDRLYVFDMLKHADALLDDWNYAERYALIPRVYAARHIETLALLKTSEQCLQVLSTPDEYIEGLVFRAPTTRGFVDTSIVRCRKSGRGRP